MISDANRAQWARDGYFILRGAVSTALTEAVEREVIDHIRADPPADHPGQTVYPSGDNYLIYPETAASPTAVQPEDLISKVFNCHAEGATRDLASEAVIVDAVAAILGPDIDCFQSQFIFKNPGVIGQPWHQDSYYFKFDQQPQVGIWVALSAATLENGCLWVAPGTHQADKIFDHVPDQRPTANRGYLEIVDQDTSNEMPVTMEPGDVLVFHSFLMHKSTDNVADYRRSAMVLHYGRAGSKALDPDAGARLSVVNRWIPVRRQATTAAP